MDKKNILFPYLLIIFSFFLLTSCEGFGIFFSVAVQEKIEDGSLPDELSIRSIQILTYGGEKYYFSAGTVIWARGSGEEDPWHAVGLPPSPPIGGKDTGIQSIASSDWDGTLKLYAVIYTWDGPNAGYESGLYRLDDFSMSSKGVIGENTWSKVLSWEQVPGKQSSNFEYQTVNLFGIDNGSSTDLYYNIIGYKYNNYLNIDFINSTLYRNGSLLSITDLGERYITGMTYGGTPGTLGTGGRVWLSAIQGINKSSSGIILSSSSGDFNDSISYDYDNSGSISAGLPVRSIYYAPHLTTRRAGIGEESEKEVLFLAGMRKDGEGIFPVYYTNNGGTSWYSLPNTSADYQFQLFFDATETTAANGEGLILGGSTSYINGSRWFQANGYYEIDVESEEWTVKSRRSNYSYALSTNYAPSDLASASVSGFTYDEDTEWLFASTWNKGTWRLNTGILSPSWTLD